MEAGTGEFWITCLDELKIERTKEQLLFFVHALRGWAPQV
jgi:hypothetical protein